MTKTILGVQLAPHGMCTVRLKRGWRSFLVDQVRRAPRGSIGTEAPEASAPSSSPSETVVASIPSDAVFHREIELPFSDLKKLEQAAPLEAEESLPLPLEELVCDVQLLEKRPGRSEILVIASPSQRVDSILSDLSQEGLSPTTLDVDALALGTTGRWALGDDECGLIVDLAPELCQAVLLCDGVVRTFHTFTSAATDPSLLQEVGALLERCEEFSPDGVFLTGPALAAADSETWSQALGLPVKRLPFPQSGVDAPAEHLTTWPGWAIPLGLALRGTARRSASRVNLLRGPFALSKGAPPWRQTAIAVGCYAAVLLVFWGATVWMEAHQLDVRREALERSIRATFQEALPDVHNVVNEVEQLRTRVTDLEEEDRALTTLTDPERSPLRILRDISAKIPKDTEVEFRDLSIDGEKVRIEGSTTSYRASERVKSEIMAVSPRFANASSDAKDGSKPGEVLFTLSVNLEGKR